MLLNVVLSPIPSSSRLKDAKDGVKRKCLDACFTNTSTVFSSSDTC